MARVAGLLLGAQVGVGSGIPDQLVKMGVSCQPRPESDPRGRDLDLPRPEWFHRAKASRQVGRPRVGRGSLGGGTMARVLVLVATRKGAWLFRGDGARRAWRVDGPHFLGHVLNHLVLDPRDRRTLLAAAKTGHLGPTVFRSTDLGRTWKEAARPPAFAEGRRPRRRPHLLAHPGPRVRARRLVRRHLAAGPLPLRGRRRHLGAVLLVNDDPQYRKWMGTVQDGTPDGPKLHSILVDPRDPAHLYFAMSSGGVHESLDGGQTWAPLVAGMEVVEGFDAGRPDVPRPALRPALPEQPRPPLPAEPLRHLPDRPAVERVGAHREEHAEAGGRHRLPDGGAPARRRHGVGLPDGRHDGLAAHEPRRQARGLRDAQRRPDLAAPRRRPARAPGVVDGQAAGDGGGRAEPVGLYFGTTSGELWASRDEGRRWSCIARHLPEIYAVEAAELA